MRRKTTPAAQAQSLSTRSAKQAVIATASLARMHRILSRSLRASAKELVLSWTEGQPMAREADVVLLQQGKTLEARVDLAARMLISLQERKDVQAPFLASEIFGADEAIKKDPRVVEALKKRGLTDLNTVRCDALRSRWHMQPFPSRTRNGSASAVVRNSMDFITVGAAPSTD